MPSRPAHAPVSSVGVVGQQRCPPPRPYAGVVTDFSGFPVSALDFYDDLEVDNTRSFWEQHKPTYDADVRGPMVALCEALGPEFGDCRP